MKPGLNPVEYTIPAAEDGKPGILIVDNSRMTHKNLHGVIPPTFVIPVFSQEIAQSIVEDYVKSKICSVPGEIQPAVFFLEGEWTAETVLKTKKDLVDKYLAMQNLWFIELVKMGDIDWAKKPGSHQMVTADAKRAAKALGYERPWLLEVPVSIAPALKNCKGCANPIPVAAIVCGQCRTVQDEKAYAGLKVAANA